ncbi:GATSlike protein 1, putative [Acanthamoeba castellanii str. Neff]|uniref:GATSlike protein 1, putative n=1 Tax=Acanthamoeba castellanii (strain ATCC 30010 / Neff) TaxID=1257118 RepID=L8GZB7_ACACF|nr:GATSlike protein 1, putative [Acanthamoeba castellanii str. Neff]ELR17878.1 GATSlike protein 1, putative [Acanthamoeba castellanii str. Neff]
MGSITSLLSPESISTLPQRLRLASIQRDDSDVCLKVLLQRAFYPQRLLSGGITQEGINVIYFSTFNTDLLLVDEAKLDRALTLLKKTLADFNSGAKQKPTPPTRGESGRHPVSPPGSSVSKQMLLSPLPKHLSLACMATSSIPSCTHQLLKAFLSKTPFFSFTVSGDELSLILDDELMADFPEDVLAVHSSQWKSVQVDFGSLGFTDMGVVSLLADILAQEGISIYYLSTFSTDFILVEQTISVVSRRLAQMERAM